MKHIRVLHTEWSDGWGGQEIRIINEMLAVRESGVEVFLACRKDSIISKKALEQNIEVFKLPFKGIVDIKTILTLYGIIKNKKIDIVNTHSGKDTWTGGIAAKLAGAKFIRTRHLSNRINSSRLNFINELADLIITTGEYVKNSMIKYNRIDPDKIVSIPTGVDEMVFDPSKYDKKENRKLFGIRSDQTAIGILAVLRKFKRHDIFVTAAEVIAKQYPNTVFLIAGDGPQKENIENLIKLKNLQKQVKMVGYVSEPARFLSAIDLFMLTSDSNEGVPQAIIQALMMRLPIVAADVGSVRDLWYEDNFMLIEPASPDIIAANAGNLIKNKELRNTYSNRARDYAVKNSSKAVMTDKLLRSYGEILND